MTAVPATVASDPLGVVVDVVAGVESALARTVIAEAVASVAAGRAKRRRLAQSLLDRPEVLTDGRSPALRVVGDLLIALRKAGAASISPPVCAECDRPLRSFQRRGQDWYCGGCGPQREACTGCGQARPVARRDRDGQPRCVQCPPADQPDPVDLVVTLVTGIDPTLSADLVAAAVRSAAPQSGQRQRLAWALADQPDLLTTMGATAPVPAVLRLIDTLCAAGAQTITRPACPRCLRVIGLHRRIDGQWLCRNCVAKTRAQPCSRCGTVREAATRDEHGRPLCPYCLIIDPANQERCIGCGQTRPVNVRTPNGPLCPACRPGTPMTCSICGRHAPCAISKTTAQPWCDACQQRWAHCASCGELRLVRGGTLSHPLCAPCTRPDPQFWSSCPHCGQPDRIHKGQTRCARCTITQRLHQVLGNDTGQIHPELQALYDALIGAPRPDTVVAWLDRSPAPAILRSLAGQPLTHQALDNLPAGKAVKHLRSVLVAIGTLPARDEHLARLQHWVAHTIAERSSPDEQHLLHRYADWHLLRRLRGRLDGTDATYQQAVVVQGHIKAAITLLDWLTERGLSLATCQQPDLDAWLAEGNTAHRRQAGHFVRWAKTQKLTRLELPATRWDGPSGPLDHDTRWRQARRLLHEDSAEPEDRLAGLLVLLYAQRPATISRLTLAHVDSSTDHMRLRLGQEPIILPEPLADLLRTVVATRRGHAAIGDRGTSPWLFPGGQPGRPISAYQLAQRLHQLGIKPGQSRSTALFQLATDLPAALLARLLGIHISVAVAWQRASGGDWTAYAAEVSRRTPP